MLRSLIHVCKALCIVPFIYCGNLAVLSIRSFLQWKGFAKIAILANLPSQDVVYTGKKVILPEQLIPVPWKKQVVLAEARFWCYLTESSIEYCMLTKGDFCRILTKHSYTGKTLKVSSDQRILETANEGCIFTTFTMPSLCVHLFTWIS